MIGEIVGHYKILEKLGEGGMGIVYLARDMRLDRRVAVKFISSALAGRKDALRKFQEEARRASAIDHPNICTIYEIGHTADKNLFLVMAFCRGQTLGKMLQEHESQKLHFHLNDSIHIVLQICDALVAAHQVGLIHCDVKPQNIILSPEGRVKLIDFGIAPSDRTLSKRRAGYVGNGCIHFSRKNSVKVMQDDAIKPHKHATVHRHTDDIHV